MSELYLHEKTNKATENKKLFIRKETLKDSEKGFFFKYLHINKTDNKVIYKIECKLSNDDKNKYIVTIQKGEKKENMEVDKKGLLDIVKKEKSLSFVSDYLSSSKKKK